MYDRASRFMSLLYNIIDQLHPKRTTRAQFWAAAQRFFRQLLIASKVSFFLLVSCVGQCFDWDEALHATFAVLPRCIKLSAQVLRR